MRIFALLILGLMVVNGCGKKSNPFADVEEWREGVDEQKALTVRVVGTYEYKDTTLKLRNPYISPLNLGSPAHQCVLVYENGVLFELSGWLNLWLIVDGEIHIHWATASIKGTINPNAWEPSVCRINPDGSLTVIATIDKHGKRQDIPKETAANRHLVHQITYRKIK